MMEPLDKKQNAFILEFKVRNPKREKDLEETAANALKQISEKDYDRELLNAGVSGKQIFHYGFAFEGKKVLIR